MGHLNKLNLNLQGKNYLFKKIIVWFSYIFYNQAYTLKKCFPEKIISIYLNARANKNVY